MTLCLTTNKGWKCIREVASGDKKRSQSDGKKRKTTFTIVNKQGLSTVNLTDCWIFLNDFSHIFLWSRLISRVMDKITEKEREKGMIKSRMDKQWPENYSQSKKFFNLLSFDIGNSFQPWERMQNSFFLIFYRQTRKDKARKVKRVFICTPWSN